MTIMHDGEQTRWAAVQAKDRSFDGQFYFGVLTTGVYCKPSCPGRLPLRRNVRFFDTPTQAEAAGLRACKRCHPLGNRQDAERLRKVCDYIKANLESELPLAALAAQAGLSPFHFQRAFKTAVGVSPRQYVEACRLETLKDNLRHATNRLSVTGAIHEAGFGSSSRVYERVNTRLGMTPATYRSGGRGARISWAVTDSPLGPMMLGATDRGLCFVQFGQNSQQLLDMLRAEYPKAEIQPMAQPYPPEFDAWMSALAAHLRGQSPNLDLPTDLLATAFQMKVWRYLQSIPYGSVESYAEVAKGIGQPTAARAVARACAANRAALVIPCHRVIRGTGELGGYKWGLDRKRLLIDGERSTAAAANQ